MALITPQVSTHIETPQVTNPRRDALLKTLLLGVQGGIDGANQKAALAQHGDQQKEVATLKDLLEGKRQDAATTKAVDTLKGDPGLSSVSITPEGASASRKDHSIRLLADQDRNDRITKEETVAAQGEYKRLIGNGRERAEALQEVKTMLANPSALNYGQLQTAVARLRDKGALSEGDVTRVLPRTASGDITRAKNYITGGAESPLTPELIKQAATYIDQEIGNTNTRLDSADKEIAARAPSLLPHQSKAGVAGKTLQSLGIGTRDLMKKAMTPPPASSFDPDAYLKGK